MSIRLSCPHCSKSLKVADQLAGKKVRCPGCETTFLINASSGDDDRTGAGASAPRSIPEDDIPNDWLMGDVAPPADAPVASIPLANEPVLESPPEGDVCQTNAAADYSIQEVDAGNSAPVEAAEPISVRVPPRVLERRREVQEKLPIDPAEMGGWRQHSYWILLAAMLPLALSTLGVGSIKHDPVELPVQNQGNVGNDEEIEGANPPMPPANPNGPGGVPVRRPMSDDDEEVGGFNIDFLFDLLPNQKLPGAHLSRRSWMHWLYAAISAAVFLGMLTQMLPNRSVSARNMVVTGIITGTAGIAVLLAFQFLALHTHGVYLRGGGVIGLLFLLLKFIAFSYQMALDPEYGVALSFLGFTCGVGLCEELCKALPIVFYLRRHPYRDWRGAFVIGLASGIGFGISEGISYSATHYNGIAPGMIYLVRFASCVALHATWAGSVALVMHRDQDYLLDDGFDWETAFHFLLRYLLVAMVLHGMYDTFLKKDYDWWALVVAIGSFAWLAYLIRRERAEEMEYA